MWRVVRWHIFESLQTSTSSTLTRAAVCPNSRTADALHQSGHDKRIPRHTKTAQGPVGLIVGRICRLICYLRLIRRRSWAKQTHTHTNSGTNTITASPFSRLDGLLVCLPSRQFTRVGWPSGGKAANWLHWPSYVLYCACLLFTWYRRLHTRSTLNLLFVCFLPFCPCLLFSIISQTIPSYYLKPI